MSIILLLFKG